MICKHFKTQLKEIWWQKLSNLIFLLVSMSIVYSRRSFCTPQLFVRCFFEGELFWIFLQQIVRKFAVLWNQFAVLWTLRNNLRFCEIYSCKKIYEKLDIRNEILDLFEWVKWGEDIRITWCCLFSLTDTVYPCQTKSKWEVPLLSLSICGFTKLPLHDIFYWIFIYSQ